MRGFSFPHRIPSGTIYSQYLLPLRSIVQFKKVNHTHNPFLIRHYSKMASEPNKSVIIACIQMTSNEDKTNNFKVACDLIRRAKERHAKVIDKYSDIGVR